MYAYPLYVTEDQIKLYQSDGEDLDQRAVEAVHQYLSSKGYYNRSGENTISPQTPHDLYEAFKWYLDVSRTKFIGYDGLNEIRIDEQGQTMFFVKKQDIPDLIAELQKWVR